MNRILFDHDEIIDGVARFGGARAEHIMSVLHGEVGQILKTGELNGLIGTSEILSCEHSGESNWTVCVRVNHTQASIAPWVDLILAPPRPRVMKRLLPQLASLGVGRIILIGASKVEKDFWGATLLKEENYQPLLVDGLMQAGTSILPTVETVRSFRRFIRDILPSLAESPRIVAHPYVVGRLPAMLKIPLSEDGHRLVLAIGPEGGWTDEEVDQFEENGFSRYSLGSRILRTDTATIALLAQLMPR